LDEIRKSDKPYLIPTEVAEVFNCSPHAIRIRAQNGTLEFPYFRSGSRTKIPREAFIAWMEGRLNKNE
jgi:excisionase family DNA binding protein